jgi:cytochrome P450
MQWLKLRHRSVSDLDAIKTIYGAGTKFTKSPWYSVWQGRRKFDLFAERSESIHSAQRRLVASTYSMSSLKDLQQYVDTTILKFMSCLEERMNQEIDLGMWLQLFAFDVIGEVTFSKPFRFLAAGMDDGSFAQIESALRSAAWIGQVPWLYWVHDRLSPWIGNHLGITARNGSLRQFAVREVADRIDRGSERRDILGKLMDVQVKKPEEMNENAIVSMASSNIFAGSDTTAISMRAIMHFLLKNPASMQRLLAEIDTAWETGYLSDPVRVEEAERMPYMQAVMYEALRLHPAVGMSLPRVVPVGGARIDGRWIPAGVSPVSECRWECLMLKLYRLWLV